MKCWVCKRGGKQKVQLRRITSRRQSAVYACDEHLNESVDFAKMK